jgi:hypothetical protein
MGEVGFLHAFRDASIEMLNRAVEKQIFGGALKIRVLRPEDQIGLKAQAIKSNPARLWEDMADIESMLSIHGKTADWTIIEKYFMLFEMGNEYDNFKKLFQ